MLVKSSVLARTPGCEHKDRPVHARGMCGPCYNSWRWKNLTSSHKFNGDPERGRSELILGFAADRNCSLCGDAIPHKKRNCQLHPDICNACEQEYCECQVCPYPDDCPNDTFQCERCSELALHTSIEDVVRLSEEDQVKVLMARKETLKRFGGKATAMNIIVNKHPEETTYITITRAGWREDDPWLENAKRTLEEMDGKDR